MSQPPLNACDDEEDFIDLIKGSLFISAHSKDHTDTAMHASSHDQGCESEMDFRFALEEFYLIYNRSNVPKAVYLASKFVSRRWELWEQLSIKYRINPQESSRLWISFNYVNVCRAESLRRLFGKERGSNILTASDVDRKAFWIQVLGLTDRLDADRVSYFKYVAELVPGCILSGKNEVIGLDVTRTHQELQLYQQTSVQQSLTNILQVYCSLNGVRYVQGMNELLAVVYFVIQDESNAFWAFNVIMEQMKDLFTLEADSTNEGIYSQIDCIWSLLRKHNYILCKHLRKVEFPLATIAMRWMTTLLAMDVTMPDIVQIWDTVILSLESGNLVVFASCMITAYIIQMEEKLLAIDDAVAIEIASSFGKDHLFDVRSLITSTVSIYAFEIFLAGKYDPVSEEPLIDIVAEVVDSARSRVVDAIGVNNLNTVKERFDTRFEEAGNAIVSWLSYMKPTNESR